MTVSEFTPDELQSEEWRTVPPPFCTCYEVSNLGRVRRNGRILKTKLNKGYPSLTLSCLNVQRDAFVHQIVAAAFIGPRPLGKEVNHIDRMPANSRAGNLEYLTPAENAQHSIEQHARGERIAQSKLKETDIKAIHALLIEGVNDAAIGKRFGVATSTIRRVRLGMTWASVPVQPELLPPHKQGSCKLSDEQVIAIRAEYGFRKVTHKVLAQRYGVNPRAIEKIINRKSYTHI